jgi:hypothetical protein
MKIPTEGSRCRNRDAKGASPKSESRTLQQGQLVCLLEVIYKQTLRLYVNLELSPTNLKCTNMYLNRPNKLSLRDTTTTTPLLPLPYYHY